MHPIPLSFFEESAVSFGSVNTFIGGSGATYPTATSLATFLGISASQIGNYSIDSNNNIECTINASYSITSADTVSTYWEDRGGLCTSLSANVFEDNEILVRAIFPAVTSVGDNCFDLVSAAGEDVLELCYLPLCTSLGSTVGLDSVFASQEESCIGYFNSVIETANAGNDDSDAKLLLDNNGDAIYVANTTAPSAITDLTLDATFATAVRVSWTVPSSTNTLDFYEVYVDNVFVKRTVNTDVLINTLSASTSYDITILATDIYFNRSVSNVLSVTTNATEDHPMSNILGAWKFENDSNDLVYGSNGTDTSITYPVGQVGDSADFAAGTSSSIIVPHNDRFSFTDGTNDLPFSISFLVKFDSTGNATFGNKDLGNIREWGLIRTSTTDFFRIYSEGSTANRYDCTDVFTPTTGTWYHYVGTYDGAGNLKMYRDGVDVGSNAEIGTYVKMNNTGHDLIFGKNSTLTTFSLDGEMDEFIIWDKELSSAEVSDLSTDQLAGTDIFI
jgi:hypothetical protein